MWFLKVNAEDDSAIFKRLDQPSYSSSTWCRKAVKRSEQRQGEQALTLTASSICEQSDFPWSLLLKVREQWAGTQPTVVITECTFMFLSCLLGSGGPQQPGDADRDAEGSSKNYLGNGSHVNPDVAKYGTLR